ncbi:MAG: TRAP transporter small permease subunit [Pseudomonadota bacterium]
MISALARIEAGAIAALKAILGLALIAMVIVNVANAAGRYGGLPTLTGADELLVFTMIFIVMIGAVLAARERSHLSIDLLPERLAPRQRQLLKALTNIVAAVVCAVVANASLGFVQRIGALGQTSMGLGIPMVVPHLAITAGFIGMGAVSAILAVVDLAALRRAP